MDYLLGGLSENEGVWISDNNWYDYAASSDYDYGPLFFDDFDGYSPESPLLGIQGSVTVPVQEGIEPVKTDQVKQEAVSFQNTSPPSQSMSTSQTQDSSRQTSKKPKIRKERNKKYLHEMDVEEVDDKNLKSRILKAKKCRKYRETVKEKIRNTEPCQGCLTQLNEIRISFELAQKLMKRLSEVEGNGESFQVGNRK